MGLQSMKMVLIQMVFEFIIAKHRHGALGTVNMKFISRLAKFMTTIHLLIMDLILLALILPSLMMGL